MHFLIGKLVTRLGANFTDLKRVLQCTARATQFSILLHFCIVYQSETLVQPVTQGPCAKQHTHSETKRREAHLFSPRLLNSRCRNAAIAFKLYQHRSVKLSQKKSYSSWELQAQLLRRRKRSKTNRRFYKKQKTLKNKYLKTRVQYRQKFNSYGI